MTIKKRKVIYKCKTDGSLGRQLMKNGKYCGVICGSVRMDGTCGAHGNFKCSFKQQEAKDDE
jgi:hypothetical protein